MLTLEIICKQKPAFNSMERSLLSYATGMNSFAIWSDSIEEVFLVNEREPTQYEPCVWFKFKDNVKMSDREFQKVLSTIPMLFAIKEYEDGIYVAAGILPEWIEGVYKPYMESKYSEIDRDFAEMHFSPQSNRGKVTFTWQVLTKSSVLAEHLGKYLGVDPNLFPELFHKVDIDRATIKPICDETHTRPTGQTT